MLCTRLEQHVHTIGPKGEGGLDDATGAGGAGGASMKQSSAVVDLGTLSTSYQPAMVQSSTHPAPTELTPSRRSCMTCA